MKLRVGGNSTILTKIFFCSVELSSIFFAERIAFESINKNCVGLIEMLSFYLTLNNITSKLIPSQEIIKLSGLRNSRFY